MKIQDLLNQSKPCWKYAAMDKTGLWWLYREKPYPDTLWMAWKHHNLLDNLGYMATNIGSIFDIEPFDGDWKDSLIIRNAEK